jgi:hypothetical protein
MRNVVGSGEKLNADGNGDGCFQFNGISSFLLSTFCQHIDKDYQ